VCRYIDAKMWMSICVGVSTAQCVCLYLYVGHSNVWQIHNVCVGENNFNSAMKRTMKRQDVHRYTHSHSYLYTHTDTYIGFT